MQQPDIHEYIWLLNWIPKLVEYMARLLATFSSKRKTTIENQILDYLNTRVGPASVDLIWAEVILDPIVGDLPFEIAFPEQMKGWQRIKLEIRRLPYEIRHRWRNWRHYIPKEGVNKVMLTLLRQDKVKYSPITRMYSRKG